VVAFAALPARGAKNYGPGVSDIEIKIGNTAPYSGPASSYSTGYKAVAAYFAMINAEGGINGRKINFISLDDDGGGLHVHRASPEEAAAWRARLEGRHGRFAKIEPQRLTAPRSANLRLSLPAAAPAATVRRSIGGAN
jgi:hypothetical protein